MAHAELGAYLRSALGRPWAWGRHDCCRFVAEWVVRCGHSDPMDFLRPLYETERAALLTIRKGGGLIALWQRGMLDAGVGEVDSPHAGDVGVLDAPQEDGSRETVGIFTGERWAMLGVQGLIFAQPDVLAVWRP